MSAAPDPRDAADDLSFLVGMRLYSVVFVMDHVQLMFDGSRDFPSTLTCYVWPTVETQRGWPGTATSATPTPWPR